MDQGQSSQRLRRREPSVRAFQGGPQAGRSPARRLRLTAPAPAGAARRRPKPGTSRQGQHRASRVTLNTMAAGARPPRAVHHGHALCLRQVGPPALRPGSGLRRPGLPALEPGQLRDAYRRSAYPPHTGGNQTAPAWSRSFVRWGAPPGPGRCGPVGRSLRDGKPGGNSHDRLDDSSSVVGLGPIVIADWYSISTISTNRRSRRE